MFQKIKNNFTFFTAISVCIFAVLATLPALWIPLGLPAEGDAVDYRIPLIKWILKNHQYPNWPWSAVDDFPMLGEFLMLPFYALSPGLARLVPMMAYLGSAVFGALIVRDVFSGLNNRIAARVVFISVVAWILGLRPLALQANLLMTDNVASCFCLGGLYFILIGRVGMAGIFTALALSTRYMIWGPCAGLGLAFIYFNLKKPNFYKNLFIFAGISILGALPFMVRNYCVNGGNPFFPLFLKFFNQTHLGYEYGFNWHGRGKDLISFLLLPYDFLYTNTFKNGFYDYTLGKLFYIQLLALIFSFAFKFKEAISLLRKIFQMRETRAIIIFFAFHLLTWFTGSQQMRFFIPNLVIVNIAMFYFVWKLLPHLVVAPLLILSVLSVVSIQGDSYRILKTKNLPVYEPKLSNAKACLSQIPVTETVGHASRGILGFFDHDFIFVPDHPYSLLIPKDKMPWPKFIYGIDKFVGYHPWPKENPCALQKD